MELPVEDEILFDVLIAFIWQTENIFEIDRQLVFFKQCHGLYDILVAFRSLHQVLADMGHGALHPHADRIATGFLEEANNIFADKIRVDIALKGLLYLHPIKFTELFQPFLIHG